MLHGVTGPDEERHLRVVKGEATLLDEVIDEDAQVEATLAQFPTVDRVILAIEGQPRLFYDWMDRECDETNDYCDARRF